jgi:transmembrane sensor
VELNQAMFEGLAAEQDGQLRDDGSVGEARAKLFSPPHRRRRPWLWPTLAVASAAAIALIVLGLPAQAVTIVADAPTTEGGWYEARDAALPLSFSDGTRVVLVAGTRARVVATRPSGADVSVERGEFTAHVVPRDGASWAFRVGPYDVAVVGTHFAASWDPARQHFELNTYEGAVEVVGPGVAGRRVASGQALAIDAVVGESPRVRAGAIDETVPAASASGPTAERPDDPEPAQTADVAASASAPPAATATWRRLFERGDYTAAWEAVAPRLDNLMASGSADDLATLADVANLNGQSAQARKAYLALRRRFPASGRATRAAFALGRMAFGSDPSGAAQWFETYLAEAPNGGLAREALGRVLEIRRSGPGGPAVARRYLDRFPSGPHAELARRTLQTQP